MIFILEAGFAINVGLATNSISAGCAAWAGIYLIEFFLERFCERVEKAIKDLGETEDEEKP